MSLCLVYYSIAYKGQNRTVYTEILLAYHQHAGRKDHSGDSARIDGGEADACEVLGPEFRHLLDLCELVPCRSSS